MYCREQPGPIDLLFKRSVFLRSDTSCPLNPVTAAAQAGYTAVCKVSECGLAGLIKPNDTSVGRPAGRSEHQSPSGESLSLSFSLSLLLVSCIDQRFGPLVIKRHWSASAARCRGVFMQQSALGPLERTGVCAHGWVHLNMCFNMYEISLLCKCLMN